MQTILSICIPAYNNVDLLKLCLAAVGEALPGYEDCVEIIISDNASEENVLECVEQFKNSNHKAQVLYSKNQKNEGLAYNFHKVVELAKGEFCWIVGTDDFITSNSIENLVNLIKASPDLAFISVNFAHFNLDALTAFEKTSDIQGKLAFIKSVAAEQKFWATTKIPGGKKLWDDLVDPAYNNVMLGSMMAGVFRRSLWLKADIGKMDKSRIFTNVENTYPHCAVFAQTMIGRQAYYLSEPAVIVGDGARPWTGTNFWDGSLPIICFKIWHEIVDRYQTGGLKKSQYRKCRNSVSASVGRQFYPFVRRKYFLKLPIKNSNSIRLSKAFSKSRFSPGFYTGLAKGFIREHILKRTHQ